MRTRSAIVGRPVTDITADDLGGCATAEGVEVRPGDVLLVRTGYAALWHDEAVAVADGREIGHGRRETGHVSNPQRRHPSSG